MKNIIIKGAKTHNLKNIDVTIPKNMIVVVTGVSGSGKSSLVFDTIFEEGRKNYLQSIGVLPEFDDYEKFDSISGLGATVAVQQNQVRQSNPRFTVGTKTKILNMLATLFSIEGKIVCSECNQLIDSSLVCKSCGKEVERLATPYFLSNNSSGFCMRCMGRGWLYELDFQNLIPNNSVTLEEICQKIGITRGLQGVLQRNFRKYMKTPFVELSDEIKRDVIYGHFVNGNYQKQSFCLTRFFEGKIKKGDSVEEYYKLKKCPECFGFRVGESAREVFIAGKHIGELGLMTLNELSLFINGLSDDIESQIGLNILSEIKDRVKNLIKSHLGHLSLYRELPTLSGGEIQRLFLNSHLNSNMDSIIYILDEPTAGLHESEKKEFIEYIKRLKKIGNSVIIVEHDRSVIEIADYIIDIGPKAGIEGGEVMYQGVFEGVLKSDKSITGQYLSKKLPNIYRDRQIINDKSQFLKIYNAKTNNLKDISVSIPLKSFVGIAGLSGSGKSSLISETLSPLLREYFEKKHRDITKIDENITKTDGFENISGYIEVSQEPIGRNINSNPATYIGAWDKIRELFAKQKSAIDKNLTVSDFSFNSSGACSNCGGSGEDKIWMGGDFFIYKTCKECEGKRFNSETLSVKYKNRDISDVLNMSISEATDFFKETPSITSTLNVLNAIGMGYIKLGQPTPTLSGGESQRIKLAKEIGKRKKGKILYILDEPTVGLSQYDTEKLIKLLDELVKKGNSVIVVEHDVDVLVNCDWIIELGPKGGTEGGYIIAEGTPETLKNQNKSIIGDYL
ncbi:excinuclease ABC subunit UvrA [bacterium]|nr:excinuclease ABC subunit UvrA [bacterium]